MKKKMMIAGIVAAMTIAGAAARVGAAAADKDIVDTAVAAGSFKTLAKALEAADLVETLKGAGPFTVFAPTDEAFAKLPAGTLEALLKPENKPKLQRILKAHVVAGRVMAADVVKTSAAKAVSGFERPVGVDLMLEPGESCGSRGSGSSCRVGCLCPRSVSGEARSK